MEGGGHYLGAMAGPVTGPSGAAFVPGRAGFSILRPGTIAHELGHNLGLHHAPCGGAGNPDPSFPHVDGSAGAWGYDFARGELGAPRPGPDVYCGSPRRDQRLPFGQRAPYGGVRGGAAIVPAHPGEVAPALGGAGPTARRS